MSFHPGEWAVLRHDQGGRLFEVYTVGEPEKEGRLRIGETPSFQGQPSHEVWDSQLVKVPDREAGVAMVAQMTLIHEDYLDTCREAKDRRNTRFAGAVQRHRTEEEFVG